MLLARLADAERRATDALEAEIMTRLRENRLCERDELPMEWQRRLTAVQAQLAAAHEQNTALRAACLSLEARVLTLERALAQYQNAGGTVDAGTTTASTIVDANSPVSA